MRQTKFTVEYGGTFNLGNRCFARIHVTSEAELEEGDDAEVCRLALFEETKAAALQQLYEQPGAYAEVLKQMRAVMAGLPKEILQTLS
jgi:hypothetical protein